MKIRIRHTLMTCSIPRYGCGVDVVIGGTAMMMNLLSVGVLSETEDSGQISTSLWLIKPTVGDEIYSPPSSATQQDPSLFEIISRVGDGLPCCFACQKNRRSSNHGRSNTKKKADYWNDSAEAVSEELDAVGEDQPTWLIVICREIMLFCSLVWQGGEGRSSSLE